MIDPAATAAFNNRITATVTVTGDLSRLTPSQLDALNAQGERAAQLLANHDLVQFIHLTRFEILDTLTSIVATDAAADSQRVALAHNLAGIDRLVAALQRAVYQKNRVSSVRQEGPAQHTVRDVTKEIRTP